jgi:hypothetical protein
MAAKSQRTDDNEQVKTILAQSRKERKESQKKGVGDGHGLKRAPGRARLGCRGIVSANLSELTFPETLPPHARCGCIGPAVASPSDPHAFIKKSRVWIRESRELITLFQCCVSGHSEIEVRMWSETYGHRFTGVLSSRLRDPLCQRSGFRVPVSKSEERLKFYLTG